MVVQVRCDVIWLYCRPFLKRLPIRTVTVTWKDLRTSTCHIPLQARGISTNLILYQRRRIQTAQGRSGLPRSLAGFFVSSQTPRCFSWKLLSVLLSFTSSTAWFRHLPEPGLHVQNTVQELQSQDSERAQLVLQCSQAVEPPLSGWNAPCVPLPQLVPTPTPRAAHLGHVSTQLPQIACRFFTRSNVPVCKLEVQMMEWKEGWSLQHVRVQSRSEL